MSDDARFFDDDQRRTVEAAMARIIPTDHQPGAREVGVIEFLDRYLSGIDYVFAKPDGSGFERLDGLVANAWRERIDRLRAVYRAGIAELDRRSREQYGDDFHRVRPDQQDDMLAAMERDTRPAERAAEADRAVAAAAPEPALQQTPAETDLAFFPLLVLHTRQGFYADPIYGGNRDHAGWQVIGFPGPASLAEAQSGRYNTLPYFAQSGDAAEEETRR